MKYAVVLDTGSRFHVELFSHADTAIRYYEECKKCGDYVRVELTSSVGED